MKVPLSQPDARKVYVECNSITVNENFPLLPKKKKDKRLIAGYLNTLMALLSFFLTATAEYDGARKAPNSRRSDSVGRCKEKREKEKEVLRAGREGEETLLSPFSFLPLFFPLLSLHHSPPSEHLEQASARTNAAIHKEFFFILLHKEL